MPIEQGFTLGHEYVGTVIAAGEAVANVGEGDRVLGTYGTACGECFFCLRGEFHQCDRGRVFGHGSTLGSLQGAVFGSVSHALVHRSSVPVTVVHHAPVHVAAKA